MDTKATAVEAQHPYPINAWNSTPTARTPTSSTAAAASPAVATSTSPGVPALEGSLPHSHSLSHIPDTASQQFNLIPNPFPFLLPQQSNFFQHKLKRYNELISPSRGGGLQTPPLPPVVSAPHIQAAPRPRSSSKASTKDTSAAKGNTGGGHGGRSHQNSDKNRSGMTPNEPPSKMAAKQSAEPARNLPRRPTQSSSSQAHSSSVPSTPHQHARQFSFEDREPSPTGNNNHSPRSAYSETSTLPSLRPLPPRLGGCKYETAQINSRRRIPYSTGSDPLERLDLKTVKGKLSEDDERKLATDMRTVFDRLLPTDKVEQNRRKMVLKLEKIFNDEWPNHSIRVHLFGSSGNLLCSDDSDVDICITTAWRAMEDVCMIADLLAKRGMEKVVCISAAKVPIVKIWDPELGLACDMNVNNTLALENTRMVRTYVEIDPRVRQLAMIIKHWTRRRIVNDAAFGGTLSSYTWICLIIAFLQLRTPPVLPALHQLPHKLTKPDGAVSEFADDLGKLSDFGKKNKSSVAQLLFQFFRFYAHEFDYEKHALSVRLGKVVTKQEKKWNYSMNNQLCVEEPFNFSRNLGNTADEYSFKGLHMELRRAFDLISAGKFEEACEQYVFPKEEERVWSRPPPQSRPVLLRSSSQTHSGRGGRGNHRGGRHNNNFHRGGNSSRRASSSVPTSYEANNIQFMQPVNMQQDMSWYQASQFQLPYPQQDFVNHMLQQESMRQMGFLAQIPAYMPHQAIGQQQRMPASSGSGQQQSSERPRTNSFDNPPLTAPLQPDLYAFHGMTMAPQYFLQAGAGYTYPLSPATASVTGQEFRRSLQRSSAATDSERASSSSAQRSHSQPASRSPSSGHPATGYFTSPLVGSVPSITSRNVNGLPIPSFMPSDDIEFDETRKGHSESPKSMEDGKQGGIYVAETGSPTRQAQQSMLSQAQQGGSNGLAFGDLANQSSPGRRRLSTDQLPQTILDRRMRRTSRSPSPLGHARAFSVGTSSAPLTSAPFPGSQNKNPSRPLVVNGSGLKTSMPATPRKPSGTDSSASEDSVTSSFDNPLQISTGTTAMKYSAEASVSYQPIHEEPLRQPLPDRPPVVANGSNTSMAMSHSEDPSFRERIAKERIAKEHSAISRHYLSSPHIMQEPISGTALPGTSRLSPSTRQRLMSRQPQNGVIAPLDLAITEDRINNPIGTEFAHLSPVYETRTPSPTVVRKFDGPIKQDRPRTQPEAKANRAEELRPSTKAEDRAPAPTENPKPQRAQKPTSSPPHVNGARENGHARGAKSESDNVWQKAGKSKKKASNAFGQQGQGEQLPKNESERKGG